MAEINSFSEVIEASPTEASIELNPDREYTAFHDGENASGTPTSDTIYLSTAAAVVNDEGPDPNKCKLKFGRAVVIGPGVSALYYKVKAAGGSPTFTIMGGPKLGRKW